MTELLYILLEISLPIIILIAVGFGFQKIFKTDSRTFIKLLVYLLVPIIIFVKIYKADFTWDIFLLAVPFVLLLEICLILISFAMGAILRYNKSEKRALSNALVLFNAGNYGLPLIELVFGGSPVATASQLVIIIIQNITRNTFGVYNSSAASSSKHALKNIIKIPSLYALTLILIFKLGNITIPTVAMVPLDYMANAFIAVALITLGVQLAEVRLGHRIRAVLAASSVKIIAAPLLGFGLVLALGIKGLLAQALIIGISTPTAVTSAILAKEFGNEADYAAQVVLATTIFCTFTLPLIIYFVRQYF